MATYAEQLAETQAAISKVLTSGQSVQITTAAGTSRQVSRASLEWLLAREKTLMPLAAQEAAGRSGGGRRTRQIAPA